MIWVVLKKPGEPAHPAQLDPNALGDWGALLGLQPDDCLGWFRWSEDVHAYCDDEGLLKGLPTNFMRGADPIAGPVVFSRLEGDADVGFGDEAAATAFAATFNAGGTS